MQLSEIVHGDIRHLEKSHADITKAINVHGDIRHLETDLIRRE